MVRLFPTVHRLLQFLLALEKQHLYGALVRHVAVLLKLLANAMPYVRRRDVQRIKGTNFGSLEYRSVNVGCEASSVGGTRTARTHAL